jgi:lipopolysaccharide biosynthesis glycosyltransferase
VNVINVLAACDANFVQHLGVMLVSLLEANPDETFHVYLITTADPRQLDGIHEIGRRYGCRIEQLKTTAREIDGLPVAGHISSASYLRLIMGAALPADVERVLYLDSDIVVTGAIGELWRIELGENVVAACVDEVVAVHRKLGLSEGAQYFNAGVMLVDLKKWREADIGARAIDIVRTEPHRITWWDQCALNFVLQGSWLPLDRRWNLQTHALGKFTGMGVVCDDRGRARSKDAAIVHFTTPAKPWQYMAEHPLKHLYWRYLKKTPWRGYRPPDWYPHNVILKTLARYCPPMLPVYMRLRRFV